MNEPRYFYGDADQNEIGPFKLADMRAMMRGGLIKPTTMVYRSGSAAWVPAKQMRELKSGTPLVLPAIVASIIIITGGGLYWVATVGYRQWDAADRARAAERQQEREEQREAWRKKVAYEIASGRPLVGMTWDEVKKALGTPKRINAHTTPAGTTYQLVFDRYYVYIGVEGMVTSYQGSW